MNNFKKYSLFTFASALIMSLSISGIYAQADNQEEYDQPEMYQLTGEVVDVSSGEALPNVEVTITSDQITEMMGTEKEGMSETTNEDGEFTFTKLPAGQLTVTVDHEGYETWEKSVNLMQDSQLTIELQPSM